MPTLERPAPFRTNTNDFAYQTMHERVPGILRDVQAAHPDYAPGIQRAIDDLHAALMHDAAIPMLDPIPVAPPDYDLWAAAYLRHRAADPVFTWLNSVWFFAETFLYRHLLHAVRWHETGLDPFAAKKHTELASARFGDLLAAALSGVDEQGDDDAARLLWHLEFALWGNRVDLSHPAGDLAANDAADSDLLVDDRAAVVEYLLTGDAPHGPIHIVADNAGSELAMDLVLIDTLLALPEQRVILHVKAHPTFVSDATIADVWHTLDHLAGQGAPAAALVDRLRAAWRAGLFALAAPSFWVSGDFLWQMPAPLRHAFTRAHLVILKGDANYRRAIGDTIWPEGAPFAAALSDFPAPLLALRTLKCDALVGVPAAQTGPLAAQNPRWRVTGQYGVLQFTG